MNQQLINKKRNIEMKRQLGMAFGTAFYRLLRSIIYQMATELNRNICFRCGNKIEPEEFSIEHKKPWLHVSPDLFFDLNNISFSHKKCNSGAARVINREKIYLRKIGPVGTSWCTGHKQFLPIDNFSKNKSIWNGLQRQCDSCRKLRNKKRT